MTRILTLLALVVLAACGADGEPIVSGAVNVGPGGIVPTASVNTAAGPFSVNVGL
ncbi:MAG: hypothetical protein ACU0CO_04110 [Shimia sp.]